MLSAQMTFFMAILRADVNFLLFLRRRNTHSASTTDYRKGSRRYPDAATSCDQKNSFHSTATSLTFWNSATSVPQYRSNTSQE